MASSLFSVFLVTGINGEVAENQLAMHKILCGMKINEPILRDILLGTEETGIAESLLNAIITKWDKIGQTSFTGLRGTFLMRNGVIEMQENVYQLLVENSGTDILLDFLPWNICMAKLPWLETVIYTTWR